MSGPVQSLRWWMSPAAHDSLRHLQAFKTSPLETMAGWWRQHGDALRFRLGPKVIYLLSHPDLAGSHPGSPALDRFLKVC